MCHSPRNKTPLLNMIHNKNIPRWVEFAPIGNYGIRKLGKKNPTYETVYMCINKEIVLPSAPRCQIFCRRQHEFGPRTNKLGGTTVPGKMGLCYLFT